MRVCLPIDLKGRDGLPMCKRAVVKGTADRQRGTYGLKGGKNNIVG